MVYWVFVILYVALILTPVFVHDGGVRIAPTETGSVISLSFLFATAMLLLFWWKYSAASKCKRENLALKKEALSTQKDIATTYSYIGQINRKLEILRSILLGLPQSAQSSKKQEYHSILDAIRMFSHCQRFVVGFYEYREGKVLREIKSTSDYEPPVNAKVCVKNPASSQSFDTYSFIKTKQRIYHVGAYAILEKSTLKTQDVDLIHSLLAQALFFFIYSRGKTELRKKHRTTFYRT